MDGIALFDVGVFPSAWYSNVRQIASKSPLLLSMGAEQYLDKELEINHPLKIENIAPVREFNCFCLLSIDTNALSSVNPFLPSSLPTHFHFSPLQTELQAARQSLVDLLGKSAELDRLVYRLTFVQCMYLRSIYRLESLR